VNKFLVLLMAALPLSAQSSYGRVTGRVTDATDALIAGAVVRIVQLVAVRGAAECTR
jgi:hypothetical protein